VNSVVLFWQINLEPWRRYGILYDVRRHRIHYIVCVRLYGKFAPVYLSIPTSLKVPVL